MTMQKHAKMGKFDRKTMHYDTFEISYLSINIIQFIISHLDNINM